MTLPLKDDWVDSTDSFYAADQNDVAALINTSVQGSANGTPTNLTLWVGTQAQYDAIGTPDPNTVYFCT